MATYILHRLPISTRIAMLVAIPMILIVVFAVSRLLDLYERAQINTAVTGELVETMSNLVHGLQTERGMSATYIANDDTSASPELSEIRAANTELTQSFKSVLSEVDTSTLHDETLGKVDQVIASIGQLDVVRQSVDQQDVTVPEMVSFYTNLNSNLVDIGLAAALTIDDKNIAEQGMAMSIFVLSKDSIGLERAVGSLGFSAVWTPKRVRKLAIAAQRTQERFRSFQSIASGQAYEQLKILLENEDYQNMMTIRNNVLARNKSEIKSITQEIWSETATAALAAMKEMENALILQMRTDMQAFDDGNRNGFIQNLTGLSALVAIILTLSILVARDISRGLSGLNKALKELGESNLDIEIPGSNRKDQLGSMARSVVVLREGALEKRTADAEMEKTRRDQTWMAQQVGKALSSLNRKMLTYRIEEDFPEDFNTLRLDFNDSAQALETAVMSVSQLATTVGKGTQAISTNTTSLAQRTESQANALEQTTSAMNELTQSVRQSAENADEVEKIAQNARADVAKCNTVVNDTVEAMEEIRTSSSDISAITKVIEDIAFQTNLLALNAGVEAARAGEAGRGFAVVASEVRVLAQRCTDAVGQIDELTNRSSGLVDRGADLVGQAGNAMDNVNDQVSKISGLMEEIAQVVKEQAHQLSDINGAVGELEQVTQKNASMVEETTAASVQLSHQAGELNQLISQFSVSEETAFSSDDNWSQVA
ncbi:methyl-accepting chemotaxis protein [Parasedimentitalea maritima]|uniref:Methyl-accepting chemotaxis protein n=1 Tax=Parasedimentitalea maritima TaxID=2578117 RepID=A0ABY2UUK2_9RHOB|nr:methyl-accepting chemotaxis protein [Zongyanglinia marina]TLP64362.1 methyl-accepting chemotaxis protein [Zongyanglinia marina]